jgi:branched-chain amino acid transport system permease protein
MGILLEHPLIGVAGALSIASLQLGFVLIYKATGIFNIAQGSLMAVGAFMCYFFSIQIGLPFFVAVLRH